jgi:hypothetical protein
MLTRILHNSAKLCAFLDELALDLYQPQRRHLLNMADALLVCDEKKTLAALQRQFVEAPDVSNMADFLRISPWQADDLRNGLRVQQVQWLIAAGERTAAPRCLYINLDDSLGAKDKATRHLEAVEWHYDHNESQKGKPRYKNAFCFLACTVRIGEYVATVDLRLYLREKTVRRLNRQRTAEARLPFRSKNHLAYLILEALRPLLPTGWQVYVQFDSWYASKRLIKYVLRQGWHVTCALKHNRLLDGLRLDTHAQAIRHRHYTKVCVTATDSQKTTYFVRRQEGRLADIPHDVRVFFSKWHPRAKALAYILCTDLSCSAKQALQGYCWRWSCEVVNFYTKTQLGLTDFRVQSYEAVDKYMVVVHLAWAYVEYRFAQERSAQVCTYGDIIRRHRDEHAIVWLRGAIEKAIETGDTQAVIEHFLRLQPTMT